MMGNPVRSGRHSWTCATLKSSKKGVSVRSVSVTPRFCHRILLRLDMKSMQAPVIQTERT